MLNQSHTVAPGTPAPAWGILRLEAVKAGLFPDSIPLGARALKLAQSALMAVNLVGEVLQ